MRGKEPKESIRICKTFFVVFIFGTIFILVFYCYFVIKKYIIIRSRIRTQALEAEYVSLTTGTYQ